jgi:hypothetical protein
LEAIEALVKTLLERPGGETSLVMGRVLSPKPLRVLAEGNAQDAESLLRSDGVEPRDLKVGDRVALWPIENRQRYVILTRVVSL